MAKLSICPSTVSTRRKGIFHNRGNLFFLLPSTDKTIRIHFTPTRVVLVLKTVSGNRVVKLSLRKQFH